MTRCIALCVLVLGLAVAGCGEKAEPAGRQLGEAEPFTLMLDYFPNADHAGIYAAKASGEYERAGLDVEILTPPDPAAPLKLLAGGPRRPGDLLRAGAAAGTRQGRRPGRRRRARAEAADVPDVARRPRDHAPGAARGQARRHLRPPLPVGLPAARSSRRPGWRRTTRRRPTSASTSCRRCSPRRSTPRSARSGTTRASTSSVASATRRSCGWRTSASRRTTS